MSSRTGMVRADIDVMLMHDPKVIRLARMQTDPDRTAVTLMLYVSTVLASWREDRPMTLEESAPAWYLRPLEQHIKDLVAVEMLEEGGVIDPDTLARWMAGVRAVRAGGAAGAAKRWGATWGAMPKRMPRLDQTRLDIGGNSPAERTTDGRSLKEILADLGAEPFKETTA